MYRESYFETWCLPLNQPYHIMQHNPAETEFLGLIPPILNIYVQKNQWLHGCCAYAGLDKAVPLWYNAPLTG
jgi:hypothetical protein